MDQMLAGVVEYPPTIRETLVSGPSCRIMHLICIDAYPTKLAQATEQPQIVSHRMLLHGKNLRGVNIEVLAR